jgi:Tubulin-tyrosine ligase family
LNWEKLWVKIESIIILTVINLAGSIPDLSCSFELFGFDVMVDSNMKPWLLEVNSGPAMSMDNNIDYMVKPDLIKDVIRAVNFQPYSEFLVKSILLPALQE